MIVLLVFTIAGLIFATIAWLISRHDKKMREAFYSTEPLADDDETE